jgi:hypothetical protein
VKKLYKIADYFETKIARGPFVRELPMGTLEQPDLNNVVKNIQNIITAFNILASQDNTQEQVDAILARLREAGIDIT